MAYFHWLHKSSHLREPTQWYARKLHIWIEYTIGCVPYTWLVVIALERVAKDSFQHTHTHHTHTPHTHTHPFTHTHTHAHTTHTHTHTFIHTHTHTSISHTHTQLMGFGVSTLDEIDPNPDNFVSAGVINTRAVLIGCLLRLEPNLQTKVGQPHPQTMMG